MKIKLTVIAAMAMIPMLVPSTAEASSRCKTYKNVVYGYNGKNVTRAKVCRSRGDRWYVESLRGAPRARENLVEHIYYDLRRSGYGILVDFIPQYHAPYRYRQAPYSRHAHYTVKSRDHYDYHAKPKHYDQKRKHNKKHKSHNRKHH